MIHRRRAFTILEMVVVIGLFAMVAVISVPIFRWAMLTSQQSQTQANDVSRFENALRTLREDIWDAGDIRVGDSQTLVLTVADNRQITWQLDATKSLHRKSETMDRQWPEFPGGSSFSIQSAEVLLMVPDGPSFHGGTIPFISQRAIYTGEKR